MPLKPGMSFGNIVAEILRSYKKTGRIGNITPRNAKHALKIAQAIAAKRTGAQRK